MIKLERPTEEEFSRWFALSIDRQAEDRAWVAGTDATSERRRVEAMVPKLLPKGLDSPDHAFRVARDEAGRELGFMWVGALPGAPKGSCFLFDIYVHEQHRGQGVARAMLEWAFDALRADEVHTLLLSVRADNEAALALYEKLGFVADAAAGGARDVQMQKKLGPDPQAARRHVFEPQKVAVDGLPTSGLILDIGGGGEGVIGRIAGERVVAIDRLQEELEEAPSGPLKIVMDARELGFLDGVFQTVTAFFSLMYMKGEDHRRVFEEVFRVLAPGGRFLVWDAVFPPRGDETKDIAVFPISVDLPGGGTVSTRYGVRWPTEGRDAAYYARLAEAARFEVGAQRLTGQHVRVELGKR